MHGVSSWKIGVGVAALCVGGAAVASTRKFFSTYDVLTPPSWMAKVLRIPVFRIALGNDLVSRVAIEVHNFFTRQCTREGRGIRDFDSQRAEASSARFVELGAKVEFVTPRDGKGRVQMMAFKAKDLEEKITSAGGSWRIAEVDSRKVLAIIPPNSPGKEWSELKEQLDHFHWPEKNGMIITCDCASEIPSNAPTKCFLYVHSTSTSFVSEWKRAGFYLGAKQDVCLFDNGNTWKNSGREISERSFYLEAEAVYDKIKDRYSPTDIWVGGSCGGAPVAAYLKYRFHDTGINFFAEQSFPDLHDFVKPISPFLAPFVKGSLGGDTEMENPPPACQFSVAKLWKDFSTDKGRSILVQVEADEHISEEAYDRYASLMACTSQGCHIISFQSNKGWHHADNFFEYKVPRQQFWNGIFN